MNNPNVAAPDPRLDAPGATLAPEPAADHAGPRPSSSSESGVSRQEFARYVEDFLSASRFNDYCPNGLQVEGRPRIRRLATAVTASRRAIEQAVEAGADALLVHHGYFWRGEDPRVVGVSRRRLGLLLQHDLNLFAYHLPLDAHAKVGNNVQLARVCGWPVSGRGGDRDLVFYGDLPRPIGAAELAASLAAALGREPLLVGDEARVVRRLAWCTGGAQDALDEAIALGADAYVSGEISERTTHLAREAGVLYAAAGHHATERYGVQALGAHLAEVFGLAHRFIDDPNPV